MKSTFKFVLAALAASALLFACDKPLPTPDDNTAFTATVTSVESMAVNLEIQANSLLTSYAVLARTSAQAEETPAADIIYVEGRSGEITEGLAQVCVDGLSPETEYKIYVAAADKESNLCEDVVVLEATTLSTDADVVISNIGKDHATIAIKVPQRVKNSKNAIKWAYGSLSAYLYQQLRGPIADADILVTNDNYYGMYFTDDTVIEIKESEDNYVYDEDMGEYYAKFDAPVPGEPGIFFFGEHSWGESDWGWGEGYYIPLFDLDKWDADQYGNGGDDDWWDDDDWGVLSLRSGTRAGNSYSISDQDEYWSGYHGKYRIDFEQPDPLEASIEVSSYLLPKSGKISVQPDSDVYAWCFAIFDDMTYEMLVNNYLGGDETLVQWLLTSRFAYDIGLSQTVFGPAVLNLEDLVYVDKNSTYHLLITALGDENGYTQKFIHEVLVTPGSTKPVPVLELNSVRVPEDGDPAHNVMFNFKCTSKDAVTASYICNYEGEFMKNAMPRLDQYLNYDYYRHNFTSAELVEINSDEGLTISFTSAPEMCTMLACIAFNDEEEPSEIAIASGYTQALNVERVESDLFDALKGDWTASATVQVHSSVYDDNTFTWSDFDTLLVMTSNVKIGDLDYPETLSDDVYDAYLKYANYNTREDVDALYDEFKGYADHFNETTRAANRILCQGLNLDYLGTNASYNPTVYASAFDLFCSTSYNGYNSESPMLDFGPKWYLEVAADGSVSAPFSMNYMLPASNWYPYYGSVVSTYFGGVYYDNEERDGIFEGSFPVEVSDDHNTITLKPMVKEDEEGNSRNYYPIMWICSWGQFSCDPVISDIVLTRNTAGAASVKTARSIDRKMSENSGVSVAAPKMQIVHKPRTSSVGMDREYQEITVSPVDLNALKEKGPQKRK